MMTIKKTWMVLFLSLLGLGGATAAAYDVLELSSEPSHLASKSFLYSINKFDDRYFATGHFGHIIYSDDAGASWTQAKVPVRSSILDIYFPTAEKGWAVGHEGVILHSADGGKTWTKQFDGNQYAQEGLKQYQQLLAENPDNSDFQYYIEEMEFAISQGADKPLFKVHFQDENNGAAYGAYGTLVTTTDGGKTWLSGMHKTENFDFRHLFDVAPTANGKLIISGEGGVIMEGDLANGSGVALPSPWEGSFFTCVVSSEGDIIIGGLRGQVFRSSDNGQTWVAVNKPQSSTIIDSLVLSDGRIVIVGQAGSLLVSDDNGASFEPLLSTGKAIHGIAEGEAGNLLTVSAQGVQSVAIK